MSIYRAIIDNNICLSFCRGFHPDAQLYFDVKETIECTDVLQTTIASRSDGGHHYFCSEDDEAMPS